MMHWQKFGFLCSAALCGTTAAITNATHDQNIVPGAYIVELNDNYVCLRITKVEPC